MTRYTVDLEDAQVDEIRALLPAGTLRKKPARRRREPEDFVTTLYRMLQALERRAEGDVDLLPDVAGVVAEAQRVLEQHVAACRRVEYSWADIAARIGMTKQGAQQRYGRRPTSAGGSTVRGEVELPLGQ